MARHPWFRPSAFTILLLSSCTQPAATAPDEVPYPKPNVSSEGPVIAQIGDVTFTTKELENRIRKQSPLARAQLTNPKRLERFVQNEIRMEVLAQEAWRRKLYADPQIRARLKQIMVQQVTTDEMKALNRALEVNDAELIAAYKARNDQFNKPEKVRLSQIVRYVENDGERKAARKLLTKIQAAVLKGQKSNNHKVFAQSAREHSQDDATKMGAGDLQFLTQKQIGERYGDEVASYVFKDLKIGDLVVADAPNTIILFKKTGRRRGVTRTIDMVRGQLRGQVLSEKRSAAFDDVVDSMKKAHGVVYNEANVEKIKVDLGGQPTPAAGHQDDHK